MKVVVFGGTGMVGQGVLRECLLSPAVTEVVTVGRSATDRRDPKLREVVHADLSDLTAIRADLADADACFFCLGVSSAGMAEDAYRRITYDLTMTAARSLPPEVTFTYVSGQGTDSTEKGRTMWARVKGKTENDLLALLPNAYMFRPGYIHPMNGERPRSRVYAFLLPVARPLYPVLRRLMPKSTTTTEALGRAMLAVATGGAPKRVLENPDINALGGNPARG
ncbi:epimerase [Virgisporangium ochraceum]|uniref:Epimerase n=1 Tax=Virgisporangium ochraceum TaxID=65505 RepID=A0A8J3ZTN3_9ACTN|nr:NAD-dependent epimerase/dehydratase family protein [Virgisporangium ochraceum]GIJ68868.1 epimerase [Virgisporangium ochraceum]